MFQETLNVILATLAFGIFHSLTAAIGIKAMFVALMGQRAYLGLYRLLYNAVSVVTFAPVYLLSIVEPGQNIWAFDSVVLVGFFRSMQILGLIGLAVSLLQIDWMRFVGLSQMVAYLEGKPLPLPAEPLTVTGVYRLVRHPLYLFSLMVLWFSPTMSAGALGIALGATVYFALGSWLEEKKLRKAFGEQYAIYQQAVPWMIPFLKF